MDSQTAFVIGAILMIVNGGVLGLVHHEILPQLKPSAITWRQGILFNAGACVFFALPPWLHPLSIILLTHALVLAGTTCYWYALCQFHDRPIGFRIFLPSVVAMLGVIAFQILFPSFRLRLISVDLGLLANLAGGALILLQTPRRSRSLSRKVLASLFVGSAAYVVVRIVLIGVTDVHLPTDQVFPPSTPILDLAPILISILPVVGTTAFLLMCAERLKRRWEIAASTDYLTGLPNRRTLHHCGMDAFTKAMAGGPGFAVALVDIDHFKKINDKFGHDIGDRALRHISQLLSDTCREGELAARHGGEEFVVLLDDADAEQAQVAGERLRMEIEHTPYRDSAVQIPLTVSVGIAATDPADTSFDQLLRRADAALYHAKAEGRNRVVVAPALAPAAIADLFAVPPLVGAAYGQPEKQPES